MHGVSADSVAASDRDLLTVMTGFNASVDVGGLAGLVAAVISSLWMLLALPKLVCHH